MTIPFYNARRVVTNTGSVAFIDLNFRVEQASDVHVYAGEPGTVELVLGVDFTVSGIGTGTTRVTLVNPAGWGAYGKLAVVGEYEVSQPNDVDVGGPFGQRFENALDRQTYMLQAVYDLVQRAVKMPVTGPVNAGNWLTPYPDQLIGWNAEGTALENKPQISQSVEAAIQAAITAVEARDEAWDIVSSIDLTQFYTKTEINTQQAAQDLAIADRALKSVQVTATGIATGGGDLSASRAINVPKSSNAQAVAGSDDATAMTPLRTKDAIDARMMGVGQTWQALSRTVGVAYQNTTPKNIQAIIAARNSAGGITLQVSPDGVSYVTIGASITTSSDGTVAALYASPLLPPNWYAKVVGTGVTIASWAELKP